jgi:hypothetical protein
MSGDEVGPECRRVELCMRAVMHLLPCAGIALRTFPRCHVHDEQFAPPASFPPHRARALTPPCWCPPAAAAGCRQGHHVSGSGYMERGSHRNLRQVP